MEPVYYRRFLPDAALRPYIRSYFYISTRSIASHFPADGCPGLIINLKDPFLLGFRQNQLGSFRGIRLFGAQRRSLLSEQIKGRTVLLAVKFNPGQLPRFFRFAASELTDTSVSMHSLMGTSGRRLEEECFEAENIADLMKVLDRTFIRLLSKENTFDARISMALASIWRHGGQLAVDKLAASLHLSCRHLERLFLAYVGLPPKRMCRIVRFLKLFHTAEPIGKLNWADFAIANGFSDQAHLIRECNYFTGKSPQFYLKSLSPIQHAICGTSINLDA